MRSIYSSPLRVYLCLGMLALFGLYQAFQLPISLFPNSSKPEIGVRVNYGSMTSEEFIRNFGDRIESRIQAINDKGMKVEQLFSHYNPRQVTYVAEFNWGSDAKEALREVQTVVNTLSAQMTEEMRDQVQVQNWSEGGGFLALSVYSNNRGLTEIYNLVEPVLSAKFAKVDDAEFVAVWNPEQKEITIELIPEKLAAYQLYPNDIVQAVRDSVRSYNGGSVAVGLQNFVIQVPRQMQGVDSLRKVLIRTPSGQPVNLSDVASVDFGPATETRVFKTSGMPSVIIFATPKPGSNIKKMSEDILAAIEESKPSLPADIQFKNLVDPSEFIRSAVNNVSHEVILGATLAVLVLFFFIGSFRNIATAAIEIPMSMLLAFILMRVSDMNLNIISLGGLALSAGMNVDASVVVMENIFRHFENAKKNLSYKERLDIIITAVNEVKMPVIAATIASLVVFAPLMFTSALSYAILGDLAKTVVFSHGFSAFIALILVPTVRLQLMSRGGDQKMPVSPIHKQLTWLENTYARLLNKFLASRKLIFSTCGALALTLVLLVSFVLPQLPRELVGNPDTDWIILVVNSEGNTLVKQMEAIAEENEAELLDKFGDDIKYTFTQINNANRGQVMARLKDKHDMERVWKGLQKTFVDTPFYRYHVIPWNPAELPIPNPNHLRLVVRGGTIEERRVKTLELSELIKKEQVFPRVWTKPDARQKENIIFRPYPERWALLHENGIRLSLHDVADLTRVATNGRTISRVTVGEDTVDAKLKFPRGRIGNVDDLGAIPLGIGGDLVPLKALGKIGLEQVKPEAFRENSKDMFKVVARHNRGDEGKAKASQAKVAEMLKEWNQTNKTKVTATLEDPAVEMNDAIKQLGLAIALSILLIFLTIFFQFGNIVNALLVLLAVPFGIIGVVVSLFVFQSTLSLNSALGVILLNGIAVANSIILVDFLRRLVDEGNAPREAAVMACRKRLRPIMITCLTTLLGMMPIALGFGDGGKILQPLGIAVAGGLWVSTALTLFIVPALQVLYLERSMARKGLSVEQPDLFATAGAGVAAGATVSGVLSGKASDTAPVDLPSAGKGAAPGESKNPEVFH